MLESSASPVWEIGYVLLFWGVFDGYLGRVDLDEPSTQAHSGKANDRTYSPRRVQATISLGIACVAPAEAAPAPAGAAVFMPRNDGEQMASGRLGGVARVLTTMMRAKHCVERRGGAMF